MHSALLTGSIVVALAGTAAAQSAPAPMPALAPSPPPSHQIEERSETTALTLSIAGTVVSWGMVASNLMVENLPTRMALVYVGGLGTFLGPSFGHWYQRSIATRGMAFRIGGATVALLGGLSDLGCGLSFGGESKDCDHTRAYTLIGIGAALYAAGTIDDIVTAPLRVRASNRRLRDVALVPSMSGNSAGVTLAGRF